MENCRFLSIGLSVLGLATPGLAQNNVAPPLDDAGRAEIVNTVAEFLAENYVIEEVGQQMEADLETRLVAGEYGAFLELKPLASRLTEDIRTVSQDLHLRVEPLWRQDDARRLNTDDLESEEEQRMLRLLRIRNYYIPKVEVLPGNIGYLQMNGHMKPEYATQTLTAALDFLATADALIIDLRKNGGGYERLNFLICSYLFEESTKLLTKRARTEEETIQYWTYPVPGPKMTGIPVYVLMSKKSFSAAESLAFMLQGYGRATVVGEQTLGGGNATENVHLPEVGLTLTVSISQFKDPNTNVYYEGVGIVPDIEVSAAKALDTARLAALDVFREAETDENMKAIYGFYRHRAKGRLSPAVLNETAMQEYVGDYANRSGSMTIRIDVENGGLVLTGNRNPKLTMTPLERDKFELSDEIGEVNVYMSRNEEGEVYLAAVNMIRGGRHGGSLLYRTDE